MAAFPAMPLYTDAYLADTRHLTTEEHGAYLLLLMCAWRNAGCELEDDNKSLARITGLTPARWRRLRCRLETFFVIEDGKWRQRKLSAVHDDVAARVARNRVNGARGGRALAAKRMQHKAGPGGKPDAGRHGQAHGKTTDKTTDKLTGKTTSKVDGKSGGGKVADPTAAKAKSKHEKQQSGVDQLKADAAEGEGWSAAIRGICGEDVVIDASVIHLWRAADVDLARDVLPTVAAIRTREIVRTGKPPARLGYYRDAVLEAAAANTHAVLAGRKARASAPVGPKCRFDMTDLDHWRRLLGDPGSRFRGDYMAQNWFVPSDHPEFQACALGPNPRFERNPRIPAEIYQDYARHWFWR